MIMAGSTSTYRVHKEVCSRCFINTFAIFQLADFQFGIIRKFYCPFDLLNLAHIAMIFMSLFGHTQHTEGNKCDWYRIKNQMDVY